VQAATLRELRQVLAELELVSQVPALDYASKNQMSVSDERSPGGKRPRGGVDRKDDRERDWNLKSAEHFKRRLAGARSELAITLILKDAKAALLAHRRQPPPPDRPELSSPQWKRWVAESAESAREIARIYNVGRTYVDRVRAKYRAA
jgi:hypothetical protein